MSDVRPPGGDAAGSDHLSADSLADLAEGLLDADATAAAAAHLGECESCRARAAALEATTSALHDLGPVSMPAEVAASIDAALAAEARRPAASEPGTPAEPGADVVPDLSAIPRQRFRRPSLPASAAAAVVILAVAAIIVGHSHHSKNVTFNSAAQPNLEAPTSSPVVGSGGSTQAIHSVSTGRVYSPTNLDSLAPSLLGSAQTAPVAPQTLNPSDLSGSNSVSGGAGSTASGSTSANSGAAATHRTNRTTKKKSKNDKQTTTKGALPTVSGPMDLAINAPIPAALRHLRSDRAALLACAATVTQQAGATPLAVDFGRWSNPNVKPPIRRVPAVIMVFPALESSNEIDVYVVRPACDGGSILEARYNLKR